LKIILVLKAEEKIWANFQRIIALFIKKIFTKLSKIWVWDPGSGIPIPDPGVKKAPDPGSGSATLVDVHCDYGFNIKLTSSISKFSCP
jgi:hypothetical protein